MITLMQKLLTKIMEDFPISKKVVFISVFPVVLQLLFGAIIFFLLGQAEKEVAEELHTKKVLYACGSVQKSLMTGVIEAFNFTITKSDSFQDSYEDSKKGCRDGVAELLTLTSSTPAEFDAAKRVESAVLKTLKRADDACRVYLQGGPRYSPLAFLQSKVDIESVSEETLAAFTDLKKIVNKRKSRHAEFYRNLLKNFVIAGMCANVLLGLLLARFVVGGILQRFKAIADSTHLVRIGTTPPPLTGSDEVATLDAFIHEMVEDLNAAHKREQAVVDQAADAILTVDRDGRVLKANPAACKLWGYTDEALLSLNVVDLVSPADTPKLTESLKSAMLSSEAVRAELVGAASAERQLNLEWSISKEHDGDRVFCLIHDVTERKQLEQLRREFVAMISHDLRSPLTSLRCTLNLVEEGVFGDLTGAGVDAIVKSDREVTRLLRLINTLLDYEKMEAGQFELDCAPTKLETLIQQSVASVERLAQKKGVQLECCDTQLMVNADGDKIVQVLVNLLSNAIKFSPKGAAVKVQVTMLTSSDLVEISVEDQGKGIPPDQQELIFDKFQQVKGDGKNKEGTGLGLPIAKLIVEGHHGNIGVVSNPGNGSRFWFTLPVAALVARGRS